MPWRYGNIRPIIPFLGFTPAPGDVVVYPAWTTPTGATVARLWNGRFIDTSGSTTAGIQEAIDALKFGGGTGRVILPEGTYSVTSEIQVTQDGVTIEGVGPGTILTNGAALSSTSILGAVGVSNLTIRNLKIVSDATLDCRALIDIETSASGEDTDWTFEDLILIQKKVDQGGLFFTGSGASLRRVTIRNCVIRDESGGTPTSVAGTALQLNTGAKDGHELTLENVHVSGFWVGYDPNFTGQWGDVKVRGCVFENCENRGARFYHHGQLEVSDTIFRSCDAGAYSDQGGSIGFEHIFTGCHFLSNRVLGLYMEETADTVISGCIFDSNEHGLWTGGRKTTITGCVFTQQGNWAISTDKGQTVTVTGRGSFSITNTQNPWDLTISGCVIASSGQNGIELKGAQKTTLLSGCTIVRNGQDATGSAATSGYADVLCANDTNAATNRHLRFVGCTFGNETADGNGGKEAQGRSQYGIRCTNGPTTIHIQGCGFYELEDPLDIAGGAKTIEGCYFYLCNSITIGGGTGSRTRWLDNDVNGGSLSGSVWDRESPTTGALSVTAGTRIVSADTTTAALTVTLPGSARDGRVTGFTVTVKDTGGNAGANSVTISRNGALIDGAAADKVISTNYGSVTLYTDGTNWFTI